MKTILAFGDSLTYGLNAATGARHAFEDLWPTVLESQLAGMVRVVHEGLGGRTTMFDDNAKFFDANGANVLPVALQSHAPLDLVILFLGTNDLKAYTGGSAASAARGMETLIKIVRRHAYRKGFSIPKILIVAPPHIVRDDSPANRYRRMVDPAEALHFAKLYSALAEEHDCAYFDAATVATPCAEDGTHLDRENTRAIGIALAPLVKEVLSL